MPKNTAKPLNSTIHLKLEDKDITAPCPFCGGFEYELLNTHTPSYMIECPCGAEMHGEYFDPGHTGAHAFAAHKKAKASTIARWNRRQSG